MMMEILAFTALAMGLVSLKWLIHEKRIGQEILFAFTTSFCALIAAYAIIQLIK